MPKFKEQLFLMTAFKVYHISREHVERSSIFVGVKRASVNVWGSMEERLPGKRKKRSMGVGTPEKKENT